MNHTLACNHHQLSALLELYDTKQSICRKLICEAGLITLLSTQRELELTGGCALGVAAS
jgi:hypothetical protein